MTMTTMLLLMPFLICHIVHLHIVMGFLDKLRKKKDDQMPQQAAQGSDGTASEQPKRVKRYTSDGKPVYE